MKKVTTPLSAGIVESFVAGEIISLSGVVYTARDAAHKLLVQELRNGITLPFKLDGQVLYYTGPTPCPPGKVIGACGPTTSARMDVFTPELLKAGIKGMIGKGPRSNDVADACKKHKAVYLAAVGGAGALIARSIKKCKVLAFPELGPEAVRELEIEDFELIVAIDTKGNTIFK